MGHPKADEIREWFKKDQSRMTMVASRHFEVPEVEVIRALVGQWPVSELRADAFREIMEDIKGLGNIRIFVRSKCAVMECDGDFREVSYSLTGPFFNIDGGGVDMHIMFRDITGIFALEKQSHQTPEDKTYSIQFYDNEGNAAYKMFLWENFPNTPPEIVEKYRAIIEKYQFASETVSA